MANELLVETLARQRQEELSAEAARIRAHREARRQLRTARAHCRSQPRSGPMARLRHRVGWWMVHHGLRLALKGAT